MLTAFLQDAALVPGLQTVATWDQRLGAPPAGCGRVIVVSNPAEERRAFEQLAGDCDAIYLIAPEFDKILQNRTRAASALGCEVIGSSVDAIELCADKLNLARHLESAGVSTIETHPWTPETADRPKTPGPCVIKPRFGAGSQDTFLVAERSPLDDVVRQLPPQSLVRSDGIIQPYVPGPAISVAVVVGHDGGVQHVFPAAEQHLSEDGRFAYSGGHVPATGLDQVAAQQTAIRAFGAVSGLQSYVGVDIIIPHEPPHDPVVVEINPRLTTSYLGYRRLAIDNLAERLLRMHPEQQPISWRSEPVSFTADGEFASASLS